MPWLAQLLETLCVHVHRKTMSFTRMIYHVAQCFMAQVPAGTAPVAEKGVASLAIH